MTAGVTGEFQHIDRGRSPATSPDPPRDAEELRSAGGAPS
jgi:hypothetical protein